MTDEIKLMSRPKLIRNTLDSVAIWDDDVTDIIEPYINKLEQENAQLKHALQNSNEAMQELVDKLDGVTE